MEGKKSKVFFEVSCPEHGRVEPDDKTQTPRVKVNAPKHGNISGCPICKKEEVE